MMSSEPVALFALESGGLPGCQNMATDEALLEWVRGQKMTTLVVRTYCWSAPTISLGVNQKEGDLPRLLAEAPASLQPSSSQPFSSQHWQVVRRPTGGRAIYHGQDVSFAFVSNQPGLLKLSVNDSYCVLVKWVKAALLQLGVPLQMTGACETRGYALSSACFDTRTPSDLLDENGRKVAGCAQLRRDGGLLQHGAAFVWPYGITANQLAQALFAQVARAHTLQKLPLWQGDAAYEALQTSLLVGYERASAGILAKAATTSGSHLLPTSL